MLLETPPRGRELPGKPGRINPGKYLVYHFFAKSLIRCTPEGEMLSRDNEMGYVFDSLADAQRYCQWKAQENPKLGCTIYDDRWKIADQILSTQHLENVKRANAPRRQLLIGTLFLISGSALVWADARRDWMLIIGFLIGARLAVGGVVQIVLGLNGLRGRDPTGGSEY